MFNAIISIPQKIIELLVEALKSLFIPKDGFFTSNFNDFKDKISIKLGFATYVEMFKSLSAHVSGSVDFGGFIDLSIWDKYLPTLQNYIRGFIYALGLIFNIKMIVWMVRGSTPIEGGGKSS